MRLGPKTFVLEVCRSGEGNEFDKRLAKPIWAKQKHRQKGRCCRTAVGQAKWVVQLGGMSTWLFYMVEGSQGNETAKDRVKMETVETEMDQKDQHDSEDEKVIQDDPPLQGDKDA